MGYQWQKIPENASASPARLSEEEWVAALLYWDMAAKHYLQAIPLQQPLTSQDERIRSFTNRLGQSSAEQIRLRLNEEMDPEARRPFKIFSEQQMLTLAQLIAPEDGAPGNASALSLQSMPAMLREPYRELLMAASLELNPSLARERSSAQFPLIPIKQRLEKKIRETMATENVKQLA